jgi:hypothetical protein
MSSPKQTWNYFVTLRSSSCVWLVLNTISWMHVELFQVWMKAHLWWTTFVQKRRCIISIIVCNKLKSWWHPKRKQKTLKFAKQYFKTQSSFWVKINFDSTTKWRALNRINIHSVYNSQFLNSHRASCLWIMKHFRTKENWKNNALSIYIISSSLIW